MQTVKEFTEKLEKESRNFSTNAQGMTLADCISGMTYIWSESAAMGYCFMALADSGADVETSAKVLENLKRVLREYNPEEAEASWMGAK